MPMVVADGSPMSEQIRFRNSRIPHPVNSHIPERDSSATPIKSTISSILLSSSPTIDTPSASKKKNFTSSTFRGLGCTASSQVSVPAVIRTSANWEAKNLKKKRFKTKRSGNDKLPVNNTPAASSNPNSSLALSSSCVSVPDVWCGPGMGLVTDAASVDCVVSRRPSRGKVDGADGILLAQRERSYTMRRMVTLEDNPFHESETSFGMRRIHADISASRHHRHARYGTREGLAEIVMLQNNLLLGGRLDRLDRYGDMRLDIDNMSYEELLELGDKIGYVNTGLAEDDISHCLRRTKLDVLDNLSSLLSSEIERKCSICQEEYEMENEMGRLKCGHMYHMDCIKHWLGRKNSCPICKTAALSQT